MVMSRRGDGGAPARQAGPDCEASAAAEAGSASGGSPQDEEYNEKQPLSEKPSPPGARAGQPGMALLAQRRNVIAPMLALVACVLYCVNGEFLQALQTHTPEGSRHPSLGLNLFFCHLGGLCFLPYFLVSDFSIPAPPAASAGGGLFGGGSLSGWFAARPRTAALLFAWILIGYNYAWLGSTKFLNNGVTNALFQSSIAMVYAAGVPIFGESLTVARMAGVVVVLLGVALSGGVFDADDTAAALGGAETTTATPAAAGAAGATAKGVSLALTAAVGVTVYQLLFRYIFGRMKSDARFLAFFNMWISLWHVFSVFPALCLASYLGIETLVWPSGRIAIVGTAICAAIASTVNALQLCIALWGSVMLLPCSSAFSIPLTVMLDYSMHNVVPSRSAAAGHILVVLGVALIMNIAAAAAAAPGYFKPVAAREP